MNQEIATTEMVDVATGEIMEPQSSALAVVTGAEINTQIATARRFPRRSDQVIAREIMGRATLNEEIARECVYNLSRDGKPIIGPSVRLAEIVRASFGNIRVAARFVRIDADDPQRAAVIVEAIAMDLQTNNSEQATVRRSIMTSGKGGRAPRMFGADMTNTAVAAAISIARRNAILAVVPKALWVDAYHGAQEVIRGDAKTLNERRTKAIAEFKKLGVAPADLFRALGVANEGDITLDHMVALSGMFTAIREGEAIDAVLGRQGADASQGLAGPRPANATATLDQFAQGAAPSQQAAASDGEVIDQETGEITTKASPQTFADLVLMADKNPPKTVEEFRGLMVLLADEGKAIGGAEGAKLLTNFWGGALARKLRNAAGLTKEDTDAIAAELKPVMEMGK